MAPTWSFIRDLDDKKKTYGVKVRVVRAYGFPSYNNKEEFSTWECIFHDIQGDRIEATIPKNLIPNFKDQLDEGLVYGIKNFKVVHNMKKFKIVANKYKIILCEETKIHELFVRDFPMKRLCFRSFEEVQLDKNSCDGSLFDIIGVLVESGEVQVRSKDGVQKRLIELSIDDMKGERLICTLWEDYVDEYLELFEKESQHTNIIIVQFCKISPFKGENRVVSNCFKATKLLLNANVPEIIDFNQRLETKSRMNTTITNSGVSHGSTNSLNDENSEAIKIKTIDDLFDDDEIRCSWIIGTVDRIDWKYGWFYLSCKICTKKLIKVEHQLYCKNCNAYDSAATHRYKIKVHVKDDTGRAPFLLWDRECVQVISKTAAELEITSSEGEDVDNFPTDIQTALLGEKFLFKVLPKSQQNPSPDGYSVSKITTDQTIISTYSSSCLDSQESNCISKMEGSNVLRDKVEDDTPSETPSSKGVGEEWCDDGQVKRSLDDAFSETLPQKKRNVNIKKEKV